MPSDPTGNDVLLLRFLMAKDLAESQRQLTVLLSKHAEPIMKGSRLTRPCAIRQATTRSPICRLEHTMWWPAPPVSARLTSVGRVVTIGAVTTVNLTLGLSQPGSISGRVTAADGVTGIAGATLAVSQGSAGVGSALTDYTGAYSLTDLAPGFP